MKHIKLNKLYLLIALLGFTSCNDYLDVKPKNKFLISTIKHLDLLLNNGINMGIGNIEALVYTADDFSSPKVYFNNDVKVGYAIWKDHNEMKGIEWNDSDHTWNKSYKNMYRYNAVIEKIDKVNLNAFDSGNYTEEDRKRIKAEAKTGRAYEYWFLVNSFAKQYSKTTADTDPGVPLITKADVKNKVSFRSSVQQIYDFIIKEVNEAIEDLPQKQVNKNRPSKGCGYALLARFYLSMGNYEKALENASLAIAQKGEIGDYQNSYKDAVESEIYMIRIFKRRSITGFNETGISDELISLFNKDYKHKDFRLSLSSGWNKPTISHFPSVPEMYLIRAECNARKENTTDAIKDLNALRKKRITNYNDLTPDSFNNNEELLKFVLEERRRELYRFCLRLFDLKRLNLETAFAKSVTHTIGNRSYTVESESPNLIFPIMNRILKMNHEMKQNPRGEVIVR
jgi:tetratricopeptide (TPR) repeat protein